MKNHIYILSFIFFFICNPAIGQETNSNNLTPIKGELIKTVPKLFKTDYIYGKKIYTREKLFDLIVNDKLALNSYKKYQEKKKNARTSRIVAGGFYSIAILTSTIIPISVCPDEPHGCGDFEYLLVPSYSALAGLISGLISRTFKTLANKNFDKSVRFFNGNVKNRESIGIHLNLKNLQNGIGLVLNF